MKQMGGCTQIFLLWVDPKLWLLLDLPFGVVQCPVGDAKEYNIGMLPQVSW